MSVKFALPKFVTQFVEKLKHPHQPAASGQAVPQPEKKVETNAEYEQRMRDEFQRHGG